VEAIDRPALSEAEQQAFFVAMLAATRAAQALEPEIIRCIVLAAFAFACGFAAPRCMTC